MPGAEAQTDKAVGAAAWQAQPRDAMQGKTSGPSLPSLPGSRTRTWARGVLDALGKIAQQGSQRAIVAVSAQFKGQDPGMREVAVDAPGRIAQQRAIASPLRPLPGARTGACPGGGLRWMPSGGWPSWGIS